MEAAVECGVKHFIFSSTAAVYGMTGRQSGRRGRPARAHVALRLLQADDRDHAGRRGARARSPLCGPALFQRRRRRSRRAAPASRRRAPRISSRSPARRRSASAPTCRCSAPTIRRPTAPACATTSTSPTWRGRTWRRSRHLRAGGSQRRLQLRLWPAATPCCEVIDAVKRVSGARFRGAPVAAPAGRPGRRSSPPPPRSARRWAGSREHDDLDGSCARRLSGRSNLPRCGWLAAQALHSRPRMPQKSATNRRRLDGRRARGERADVGSRRTAWGALRAYDRRRCSRMARRSARRLPGDCSRLRVLLGCCPLRVAAARCRPAQRAGPTPSAASWRSCGPRRRRWASRAPPSIRPCAASSPTCRCPIWSCPGKTRASKGQAEFTKTPAQYLSAAYLAKLAEQGKTLLTQHAHTLAKIERELGVQRQFVLAIWGRETAFGAHRSPHYAIRALATQAYLGRRKDMFRTELLMRSRCCEDGVRTRETMTSSWAGAMGLTQFMPSRILHAWPTTSTATAARTSGARCRTRWARPPSSCAQKGWVPDQSWGYEVRLPKGITCLLEGTDNAKPRARVGQARRGARRRRLPAPTRSTSRPSS